MADYKRIGTSYYKSVKRPSLSGELKAVLIQWNRQTIVDDHGKSFLDDIEKYEGFIVEPSHLDYREVVHDFFNEYMPLSHDLEVEYREGSILVTLDFLHHIFGNQVELGLDYLCIMWRKPIQILPILCLVSEERNTGKTTFLNWLKMIFQDNMTFNTNEELRSRFNSDWMTKLIIAVDEVLLDKRQDSEKIKNLSTALSSKKEAKGKDKIPTDFFGKFILCSNNETDLVPVDEKEIRYWVRKVPSIGNLDPDLVIKLKEEIPQFIAFLSSRKIISPRKTRMWFSKEQIWTEALSKLVKGTKANLEKELLLIIEDHLEEYDLEEIKFTMTDVQNLVQESFYKVSHSQIKKIFVDKWKLEINKSSSYFRYSKSYLPGCNDWAIDKENKKGRYFTFTREFIKSMLNC